MSIFPAANQRSPDLFNLIKIHDEIRVLENKIMNARYNGIRSIVINDTDFTDPSQLTPIKLNTVIDSSNTFTDPNASVVPLGSTFEMNGDTTTFHANVESTNVFPDADGSFILSVTGNLVLGQSDIIVNLTNTMTLTDVVREINNKTSQTGIRASIIDFGANYKLHLIKDNNIETSSLIISNISDPTILSDLGLVADSYVVTIGDVISQLPNSTLVADRIRLENSNGIYIISGNAVPLLGFDLSVDITTDEIKIASHGLTNGEQVTLSTYGYLPVPLNSFPNSVYYVIVIDNNTFKLAISYNDAIQGNAINLTEQGTDVFQINRTLDSQVYYEVWNNNIKNDIYGQRMDSVIKYFEERAYIIFRKTNQTTNNTFVWVIQW